MGRRRLPALGIARAIASLSIAISLPARAEPAADASPPRARSEYRLYAGVRHPAELLTANTLTAGRLALRGVDAVTETVEDRRPDTALAIALRSGVLVFVDLPIVSYTLVVPHEAFGHGARQREFDARPEVHLDLPLPYSLRADHYVTARQTRPLYGGEQSMTTLGGLQAQEASQRMLVWTTFRTGVLRRGEALIYASVSLTHMAQTLAGGDLETASNHVRFHRGDPKTYRATTRGALALDLVDPMLLYSLYTSAYGYLVRGERATEAPSLRIGRARVLATSRTLPVPWGIEHQLHLLARLPWASFDVGVRTGVGAKESFGLELATFDWRVLRVMRVGGELAAWVQPFVTSIATVGAPILSVVGGPGTIQDRTSFGGAARLLFEVDQPRWMLGTRLGYKSAGLWGERELAAGFEVALTGGMKLD